MKIRLARESSIIVVPGIEFSGFKTIVKLDLILDTGAAYTMISRDAAMRLGCIPAGQKTLIPIVTANGTVHAPIIRVRKISLGEISVMNVPVICHDIPDIIEASGLLGLNFLRSFKTTIDYKTMTLSIE